MLVDSNSAKSFTNSRLNVAIGDPGSLSLFKPQLVTEHRMLPKHNPAETRRPRVSRAVGRWRYGHRHRRNRTITCGTAWSDVTHTQSIKGATLAELAPTKNNSSARTSSPEAALEALGGTDHGR